MSRRLPSLNALKAFEAAARHESFTVAAGELGVTHAAVSRHIRELELWLGASLFERTSRGVRLTSPGRSLGQSLTPLFDALAESTANVAVRRERRHLIVTCETAFASLFLVPRLGAFTGAHPDIDLILDPSDRLVDFDREQVDAGIRYGRGMWDGLVTEKLVDFRATPVCCPELLRSSGVQRPADLAGQTLLRENIKELWPEWLDAAGAGAAVEARGPILKGHLAILAAEAGQGFALAETLLAAEALREGRLVRPFPEIEIATGAYYLVRGTTRPERATFKTLRAWLKAEIAGAEQVLASCDV